MLTLWYYLPSLSIIVTVVTPALLTIKMLRVGLIVTTKSSSYSKILSSVIDMFKVALISPAWNVTLYDPES